MGTPGSERRKTILFCAFLGIFGGHCFYTGRRGRGLIELLLVATPIAISLLMASGVMDDYIVDYVRQEGFTMGSIYLTPLTVVSLLAYAGFLALWITDVIKIIQGTLNKVEPDLTLKRFAFLGVLLVLSIIPWQPIVFLTGPVLFLCGVFFGPIPGTIIAGLLSLLGVPYAPFGVLAPPMPLMTRLARILNFNSLPYVLRPCIITALIAVIVYGYLKLCAPESKLNRKPPDVAGKPILQGVLIGAAYVAGTGICSFIGRLGRLFYWLEPLRVFSWPFSWRTILDAAIAGFIGAALPLVLAKAGLYLGPFVTRKQAANEEAQK
jgi:TM2 domain-containing membrane protein YozV